MSVKTELIFRDHAIAETIAKAFRKIKKGYETNYHFKNRFKHEIISGSKRQWWRFEVIREINRSIIQIGL